MQNPWDAPPIPVRGDTDDTLTFAGIGRVTSIWESVEFELSNLCDDFTGPSVTDGQRLYGGGTIFTARLKILKNEACKYFILKCDQAAEGRLNSLVEQAEQFATRRHEVAHGIVFDLTLVTIYRQHLVAGLPSPQWAVVAPYYALKHHDTDGMPRFAYSSSELDYIMRMMRRFLHDLRDFRSSLSARRKQP